ncbi:hypothetical protein [Streptomyces sp. NPDC048436]|uniref:hypothetical protein n=1 Tax=Streptomyces sp. NPDC048436 TaxID=3365550 RepID=UPI0037128B5F
MSRLPDTPEQWLSVGGALAVYAAVRVTLAWRQARLEGDPEPVRAAFANEDDGVRTGHTGLPPYGSSWRTYLGLLVAAGVLGAVSATTAGTLQLALMLTLVPAIAIGAAVMDFRTARTRREAGGRDGAEVEGSQRI